MNTEELEKRIKKLEDAQIKVQMSLESKEQMKNAMFDGFYQSNITAGTTVTTAPYIKMVWKNKIIYIPYYV